MGFKRKPETVRALDEICLAIRHICINLYDADEDTDVFFDESENSVYAALCGHRWHNFFFGKIDAAGMDIKAITKAAIEMALGFKVEIDD